VYARVTHTHSPTVAVCTGNTQATRAAEVERQHLQSKNHYYEPYIVVYSIVPDPSVSCVSVSQLVIGYQVMDIARAYNPELSNLCSKVVTLLRHEGNQSNNQNVRQRQTNVNIETTTELIHHSNQRYLPINPKFSC